MALSVVDLYRDILPKTNCKDLEVNPMNLQRPGQELAAGILPGRLNLPMLPSIFSLCQRSR